MVKQKANLPRIGRYVRQISGIALLLGISLTPLAIPAKADDAAFRKPFAIDVNARKINSFNVALPGKTDFGALKFIGGLELTSSNKHFGALSGISLVPEKGLAFMVTDTGMWLTAKARTTPPGRLEGLDDVKMVSMRGKSGRLLVGKWLGDAESVQVVGNTAYVSFEREARMARYVATGDDLATDIPKASAKPYGPNFKAMDLRGNKGLEALAVNTENGTVIAITERTLNKQGNNRAFLVSAKTAKEFAIERSSDFDITDAAFLPGGDLVILERRFNMSTGVHMRLRSLPASDIAPGKTARGKVLMQANMFNQIDNMEGLDIHQNAKGESILTLISDDNHSLLQRNILLQFKLLPGSLAELPALRSTIQH